MESKTFLLILLLVMMSVGSGHNSHASDNAGINCKINSGACVKEIASENISVSFDIHPKPVASMKELYFSVTVREKGVPVTDASITVDLTMPGMFMGMNRPLLTHMENGRYEGKGIIPQCASGHKVWKAGVNIIRSGNTKFYDFVFEVR